MGQKEKCKLGVVGDFKVIFPFFAEFPECMLGNFCSQIFILFREELFYEKNWEMKIMFVCILLCKLKEDKVYYSVKLCPSGKCISNEDY